MCMNRMASDNETGSIALELHEIRHQMNFTQFVQLLEKQMHRDNAHAHTLTANSIANDYLRMNGAKRILKWLRIFGWNPFAFESTVKHFAQCICSADTHFATEKLTSFHHLEFHSMSDVHHIAVCIRTNIAKQFAHFSLCHLTSRLLDCRFQSAPALNRKICKYRLTRRCIANGAANESEMDHQSSGLICGEANHVNNILLMTFSATVCNPFRMCVVTQRRSHHISSK